jgi:hypothetical protein
MVTGAQFYNFARSVSEKDVVWYLLPNFRFDRGHRRCEAREIFDVPERGQR